MWHRGTTNHSDKSRLLLSFIMMPKSRKVKIEKISPKFEILPNFLILILKVDSMRLSMLGWIFNHIRKID